MSNPHVRLLPEPGESWVVEYDRNRQELLLNPDTLGLGKISEPTVQEQIADTGALLVSFVQAHPGASDEELTTVALSALVV